MAETNYLIEWDKSGEHTYETGVKNCVLYVYDDTPTTTGHNYGPGVAWNGITSISESPSGAEANPLYADDIKYLNLYSAEEFGCSIEAYTYPDQFAECDGSEEAVSGVMLGQQNRKTFGICYRTTLGNDTLGNELGYKLHLIYGCKASPSEKAYQTINDSPEAITFSWEITTIPINVPNFKPTSTIVIDSTKANATKLATLLSTLYGTKAASAEDEDVAGYMPLPGDVITMMTPPTSGDDGDGEE